MMPSETSSLWPESSWVKTLCTRARRVPVACQTEDSLVANYFTRLGQVRQTRRVVRIGHV